MKINWFSAVSLGLAVLVFMLAFANIGSASASQTWVMWHHEDQGIRHDETWDKCMPNDSINGHDGHVGDYLISGPYSDNDCEHLIVAPTPTNTATNTPPPTPTNTATNTPEEVPTNTPTNTPVVECGGENNPCPVTETPIVTPTMPGGIWVPTCEEMSKMSPDEFVRWTNRWANLKDANGLSCDQRGFHTGSGNSPVSSLLFGIAGLLTLLGVGSLLFGKNPA